MRDLSVMKLVQMCVAALSSAVESCPVVITVVRLASIIQAGAVVLVTSTRLCGSFARAESAVLEAMVRQVCCGYK